MLAPMALSDELERIAVVAAGLVDTGETIAGIIPTEPQSGHRVYLCAFDGEARRWLALDSEGRPIESRQLVRDAVSIAALCELAEESSGGGELEELRGRLVTLRLTENPDGIEEAEAAALALEALVGRSLRVATPEYLDEIGVATRRLEHALGGDAGSPFAEAMKRSLAAVEELAAEVEGGYARVLR